MLNIPIEDLISLFFITVSIFLSFLIATKSFKNYRVNKVNLTLTIALSALFVGLAQIFLTTEKVFFTEDFFIEQLGMLFGGIALVSSGAVIVLFCLFAYEMAFPKKTKILGILSAIPVLFYIVIWFSDNSKFVTGVPHEIGFGFMFGINQFTPLLAYFTQIPLFSLPIIILFYYALKVRKDDRLKSKRAAGLGFGGLALSTGYITEIIGLEPTSTILIIFIILSRVFYVVAGIFFYWALFKLKSKEKP